MANHTERAVDPLSTQGLRTIGGRQAVALTTALVLGVLAYQLNATMLSPALPEMARSLRTDVGSVAQASALFYLSGAVFGVLFTRWSDYIGRKRVLFIVLLVLTVGTVICIFAPNLQVLLIGRVLQGASNATYNFAYLILRKSVAARTFGTAVGVISAVNGGVGGVDGYIGGLMSNTLGFRSIFVVILTVALIAIVIGWRVIPRDVDPASPGRMDWWGALFLAVTLVGLTETISVGSSIGWLTGPTVGWFASFVVSALLLVWRERGNPTALIDLTHLRSRTLYPVLLTTVFSLASFLAVMTFSIVIIAESPAGFQMRADLAALVFLTPAALLGAACAPIAGTIAGRVSWILTLRVGLLVSVPLLIVLALTHSSFAASVITTAALGVTFSGIVITSLNGVSVVQSPQEAPGVLPGLNGAAFGIGAGIGVAAQAPLIGLGTSAGFAEAIWVAVGLSLLAAIAAFMIKPVRSHVAAE